MELFCGTLVGELIKINIRKLKEDKENNKVYLEKYAEIGRIFLGKEKLEMDLACEVLISEVSKLIEYMKIPRLGEFGIRDEHLDKIIKLTTNKNNPIKLNKDELKEMLTNRL